MNGLTMLYANAAHTCHGEDGSPHIAHNAAKHTTATAALMIGRRGKAISANAIAMSRKYITL